VAAFAMSFMRHRLILFSGSSPGAGKSTLSWLLFEQFITQGIPAHWLHEDDITETFNRFVPELSIGEATPDLLLRASSALVESCLKEQATWIIDSYLPGFYYLYGRYPDAQIEAFSSNLRSILSPLQPLLIYLRSDVETALMRGVQQRGMQWLENLTRYLNGWQLPFYAGSSLKPLRTIPDVIEFFTRADCLTVALLTEWPDALILEAADTPSNQVLSAILRHLKLAEQNIDHSVPLTELRLYTGIYTLQDGEQESHSLEISLVGGELFVNAYWPAGARLLPEEQASFRLEGTNRHIAFDIGEDGQPIGLTYYYGEVTNSYKKQN
jgi:hypothetical protein